MTGMILQSSSIYQQYKGWEQVTHLERQYRRPQYQPRIRSKISGACVGKIYIQNMYNIQDIHGTDAAKWPMHMMPGR